MVSKAEPGSRDRLNYKREAARAREWASRTHIIEVREQLLRVARMYEHLAEFSEQCIRGWPPKLEDLKPGETPDATSATGSLLAIRVDSTSTREGF
jgi:hypothetical protein